MLLSLSLLIRWLSKLVLLHPVPNQYNVFSPRPYIPHFDPGKIVRFVAISHSRCRLRSLPGLLPLNPHRLWSNIRPTPSDQQIRRSIRRRLPCIFWPAHLPRGTHTRTLLRHMSQFMGQQTVPRRRSLPMTPFAKHHIAPQGVSIRVHRSRGLRCSFVRMHAHIR